MDYIVRPMFMYTPSNPALQHNPRKHDITPRNARRVQSGESQIQRVRVRIDKVAFHFALLNAHK